MIQNLEKNWFVVSKIQKIDEFWPWHSKLSKIYTLIGSFCAKCIMFALKKHREVIFLTRKSDTKFGETLTCGLENGMRNLENFHQITWNRQNWDFDGILLSKVEIAWAKNLQMIYMYWHWRMIKNLKRTLLFQNWHEQFDKFWPKHSKI